MFVCKVPPYEVMARVSVSPESPVGVEFENTFNEFRVGLSGGSSPLSRLVVVHNGQTHIFQGEGPIEVSLEAGEIKVVAADEKFNPV